MKTLKELETEFGIERYTNALAIVTDAVLKYWDKHIPQEHMMTMYNKNPDSLKVLGAYLISLTSVEPNGR